MRDPGHSGRQGCVPDLAFEAGLWNAGITLIAGIDEAGRGALAGPVAAAALVLPPDPGLLRCLEGVRDSKQLTAAEREALSEPIRAVALAWGVGFASHLEIDAIGILPATRLAAHRALLGLAVAPEHLLLDFIFLPDADCPQTALIKGDERCLSIAAASILAKTERDAFMRALEDQYPRYGFAAHKGYCTPGHVEALQRLGPCPVHRATFSPVNAMSRGGANAVRAAAAHLDPARDAEPARGKSSARHTKTSLSSRR